MTGKRTCPGKFLCSTSGFRICDLSIVNRIQTTILPCATACLCFPDEKRFYLKSIPSPIIRLSCRVVEQERLLVRVSTSGTPISTRGEMKDRTKGVTVNLSCSSYSRGLL